MKQLPQRFLIVASFADSLVGFRAPLIARLQAEGLQVHLAAPNLVTGSSIRLELESKGLVVHNISLQRTGLNPISDSLSIYGLYRLILKIRPHFFLGYTVKPVVYGLLAAWLAKVPSRYGLITGLGYAFTGDAKGLKLVIHQLSRFLYKIALKRSTKVFFQNPDDAKLFCDFGMLSKQTPAIIVNGSGIDLSSYVEAPLPLVGPRFLLIARLLRGKGVREYAQAAALVKQKYPSASFALVGWIDDGPDAILQDELNSWLQAGALNFLGRLDDVRPAIQDCSVYVLPSYREGTPRTSLEAAAMGRPIITTDVPGCRETVTNGYNGILVPPKSVEKLAEAMEIFIRKPELIQEMGRRSRTLVESKYDVDLVNSQMLIEMEIS